MEYYYALLENYNQLKRRKFKLSLREETVNSAEDIIKAMQGAAQGEAGQKEFAHPKNPDSVAKASITKNDKLNVKFGQFQFGVPVGHDMGAVGKTGIKDLDAWLAGDGGGEKKKGPTDAEGGEATEGENTEQEEWTPEEETLAIAEKLQGLLNGDEENDGLLTRDGDEIADVQEFFPDYIPAKQHSRLQKIITSVQKKGAEQEQGLGVRGAAAQDATVVDKLYNSPDIDPEKALTALKSYTQATETISQLRSWDGKGDLPKDITPKILGELSESIKITPNGITFDGIYMSYRQNANRTNDIATNMAEQIAKAIDHHNKNCPDKDSEGYTACYIKPIKAPKVSEGKDINFARRGTLVEHAAVLADLGLMADMENCEGDTRSGPAKGRMDCDEVVALADAKIEEILADKTTAEEARKMFAKGLCAMGQQCLVDIDSDLGDAKMTELAIKYLTSDPPNGEGWTEEQAAFVLSRVTQPDQDGTKALVILVASTRGFGKVYDGLDIVDSTVEGKVGSDLPGQKTDVKKIATKKSAEEWVKAMEENQSDTERELEKQAECTDEKMGWRHLARPVDPEVSEAIEEGRKDETSGNRGWYGHRELGAPARALIHAKRTGDEEAEEKHAEALSNHHSYKRNPQVMLKSIHQHAGMDEDDPAFFEFNDNGAYKAKEPNKSDGKVHWSGGFKDQPPEDPSESKEEDSSDSNVQIDVEIKTRTNIRSGRTKTGEGQNSALSKECNRDEAVEKEKDRELATAAKAGDEEAVLQIERRKMERDFYEANDRRLDACAKAHEEALGEAPWGKHTEGDKKGEAKTMKEAACEMQGKLDARLAVVDGLLGGSSPTDSDGLVIEDTGQAIVGSWLTSRGGDAANTKNKERAKAANRALLALQSNGTPNPKDQIELNKIQDDIEVAEMSRLLSGGREVENFDPEDPQHDRSKPISTEAKAFLMYRMSRDSGSLHECAKDVRGMGTEEAEDDGKEQEGRLGGVEQRMGCINAGIYGMISGVMSGKFTLDGGISSGGKLTSSYSIKSGTTRMGGLSFERIAKGGVTAVGTIGMDSLSDTSPVGERNQALHQPDKSTKEDLFVSFLKGQQDLLEKLIDQTT